MRVVNSETSVVVFFFKNLLVFLSRFFATR
jgi:hypothetical protein